MSLHAVPSQVASVASGAASPQRGDEENPEVDGFEGILDVYEKGLKKYNLSNPTFFHHLIKTVNKDCTK